MRLDHFITKNTGLSEKSAKRAIASGGVRVNGDSVVALQFEVSRFCEVCFEEEILQVSSERIYLMMHKPAGYLSATSDATHSVALDLVEHPAKDTLHIAGRLDRASTGLLLLSNDSQWSESLTQPGSNIEKVYLVETDQVIPEEAVNRFAEGFFFETEGIHTKPAKLELLGERLGRVTICEGKYHQVKRMFHRVGKLRLKSLHRERIGKYRLPDDLAAGKWAVVAP